MAERLEMRRQHATFRMTNRLSRATNRSCARSSSTSATNTTPNAQPRSILQLRRHRAFLILQIASCPTPNARSPTTTILTTRVLITRFALYTFCLQPRFCLLPYPSAVLVAEPPVPMQTTIRQITMRFVRSNDPHEHGHSTDIDPARPTRLYNGRTIIRRGLTSQYKPSRETLHDRVLENCLMLMPAGRLFS